MASCDSFRCPGDVIDVYRFLAAVLKTFPLHNIRGLERASGMGRITVMDKSVKEKAPDGSFWGEDLWDEDFNNAGCATLVGAIYLMFFDPKVNFVMLMPIALGISYYLPKSGRSNTIPLRLGASILTFLSCFLGAVLSEFRLEAKNDGQGLFHYCSSDHIAQAFGAAVHDAPYRWYFCAAALAFLLAAISPFKSKISPPDKMDQEQGEKKNI